MDPVASKMSKSDPDSGILIHDTPEEIKRKIGKAFCPPECEGNPILDMARMVIFQRQNELVIDRPAKFGGPLHFHSFPELQEMYASGKLHPMDLKNGVAAGMASTLEPVRNTSSTTPRTWKLCERRSNGVGAAPLT
jgi:tyrosyl-tRNA synthetase